MATSLVDLATELRSRTLWQKTPMPLADQDYLDMVKRGVKKLYVDTGRASVFNNDMFYGESDVIDMFEPDLNIDEEEYVLICSQLLFFQRVATDVNNIVGYSTDALTVTNADKPYANLKDTMDRLDKERRIVYYKMPYSMPSV